MSCWTMAERLAVLLGAGQAGVVGSTLWAARNTAISAASSGRWSSSGRPRRGRWPVPGAGGVADLVGQLGDQFAALAQVGAPLRVVAQAVGDGGQPAQRSGLSGGLRVGSDAPVDDGGGVVGVDERVLGGGVVSAASGSCPAAAMQRQVLAQHGPGLGAGEAGVELVGGVCSSAMAAGAARCSAASPRAS